MLMLTVSALATGGQFYFSTISAVNSACFDDYMYSGFFDCVSYRVENAYKQTGLE